MIKEYPSTYQLKDFTKLQKQPDEFTCGPSCASMVLSFYGTDKSCEELQPFVLSKTIIAGNKIGFSLPKSVSKGLSHFGIKNKVLRGNISELKYSISNNKPVITLLRSATDLWHYVVVIGYTQNDICIADPHDGMKQWILLENFENSWAFKKDMDGEPVGTLCWLCKGYKYFLYFPCDMCFGTGYIDTYRTAIRSAGIYSNTMIVPLYSK